MQYPYHVPRGVDRDEPYMLLIDDSADDPVFHIARTDTSTACGMAVSDNLDITTGGRDDVECDQCVAQRAIDLRVWLKESQPSNEKLIESAWEEVGHSWMKQDEPEESVAKYSTFSVPVSKLFMRMARR